MEMKYGPVSYFVLPDERETLIVVESPAVTGGRVVGVSAKEF